MSFVHSAPHTNKNLSALAVEYQPKGLIGRNLLTTVPTNGEKSGTFRKRDKAMFLREMNVEIGDTGLPHEVEGAYSTGNFVCENYAAFGKVPAVLNSQSDVPINLKTDALKVAKMRLMLAQERRVANLFQTTANYAASNTVTLTGTDQWSDVTSGDSDPIGDIDTYRSEIYASPDAKMVAWMGWDTWLKLKEHPQILERVKFGGSPSAPGMVTKQALADLLEVDELYVAAQRSTTSNPGATATYSRIWGKHFGIAAVEPGQSTMFLGFGGLFVFQEPQATEFFDGRPGLQGIYEMKIAESCDEIVVANDAACLIYNAVA